jgi:hypothetical protein
MSYSTKSGTRNQSQTVTSSRSGGNTAHHTEPSSTDNNTETSAGHKPLAATLLQEFQNLKDKFKNEDDAQDKGKK